MYKKIIFLAIVSIFIFSTVGIYAADLTQPTTKTTESTKDRASRAMNNILCGTVEAPDNIDQTKTKGTQVDRCAPRTKSGLERGIVRVVGGLWQLATFWYSDPGCVTSTKGTTAGTSTSVK
jgi:hypothetical protein